MPDCIVCKTQEAKREVDGDIIRFDCPRCGAFALSGTAEATLPPKLDEKPVRRSLMSHTLRRMQRPSNRLALIGDEDLPTFWRNERLPTPQKQADDFILWIGDTQDTQFNPVRGDRLAIAAWIGLPISLPGDTPGLVWLHNQLKEKQLYQTNSVLQARTLDLQLTMKGWERYEQLKRSKSRAERPSWL